MMGDEALRKRFCELISRGNSAGYFIFTDFLGLGELSVLKSLLRGGDKAQVGFFGGCEGCERVMARFGSPDELGYDEPFPIKALKISPKSKKYAEALTHRDYLGSILALGITRDVIGDIIINDNDAYVFVKDDMSEYISDALTRIRHTDVIITETDADGIAQGRALRRVRVQAESERADGIVAKVFSLSRERASGLFVKSLVFENGTQISGKSTLSVGSTVSVRGYGRFIYLGYETTSRKGKLNIDIDVFI